jgi:hypothetical protein
MLFLLCSKVAGAKPQKKKLKPSPATMPIMLEVEVPPKPSSSAIPDPKNVINIDDDPVPVVDSDKDVSSSKPIPEEPEETSADAPANDASKKLVLSRAHGTPATHPLFFPVLPKAPLHQRHKEITNLMDEVWRKPDHEQKELADLEDSLYLLFIKLKAIRKVILAPKHWITYIF